MRVLPPGFSRSGLRATLLAATALFMTGCADSSRFADPFSSPFGSTAERVDRTATGSVPRQRAPEAVAQRPLPAPAAPQRNAALASPEPAPVASHGPAAAGSNWTAQGGTPVVVAQGESARVLADRYGVPVDALLRANGYSSASQVQPGGRLVIPVYSVAAAKTATPVREIKPEPAKAERAKAESAKPEPVKQAAKDAPKIAKAQPVARPSDEDEDDAPAAKPKAAAKDEANKAEKLAKKDAEPVARKADEKVAKTVDAKDAAKSAAKAKLLERAKLAKAKPVEDDEDDAPTPKAKPADKGVDKKSTKAAKIKTDDEDEDEKPAPKAKASDKVEKGGDKKPAKLAKVKADEDEDDDAPAAKRPVARKVVAQAPEVVKPAKAEEKTVVEKPARPVAAKQDEAPKAEKPPAQKLARAEKMEATAKPAVDTATTASLPKAEAVKAEVVKAEVVKAEPEKAPEKAADSSTANNGNPEFRWPARGRVIQSFKAGNNDGINIAVPEGTPVKAAEDGVVAYSGSELKGYGNLVLIRHSNGFVSAYANNGALDVKRGDQVKRGQTIAKSGQSGNVSSPQLHFELRKGATPVDPSSYLAGL